MKNIFSIALLLFMFCNATAQNSKYEVSVSPNLNFNPNANFKANPMFGIAFTGEAAILNKQIFSIWTGLSYEYAAYRFDQPIERVSIPEDHYFYRNDISTHIIMIPLNMRIKIKKYFYTQFGLSVACNYSLTGNVTEMVGHDTPSQNRPMEETISSQNISTKLNPSIMTVFNIGIGKVFIINEKIGLVTQLTYFQDIFSNAKIDYHDSKYTPFDFNKKGLALTLGIKI